MNKVQFLVLFSKLLNYLVFEAESQDLEGLLDLDITEESLTISTSDGIFVISRQVPLSEVWLSSPKTGPKHFGYKNDSFETSDKLDLFEVLSKDLSLIFSKENFARYEQ